MTGRPEDKQETARIERDRQAQREADEANERGGPLTLRARRLLDSITTKLPPKMDAAGILNLVEDQIRTHFFKLKTAESKEFLGISPKRMPWLDSIEESGLIDELLFLRRNIVGEQSAEARQVSSGIDIA